MADAALRAPAQYLSDSSLPLPKQARFDQASEAAVGEIHKLFCGYSIRLDILNSTIQAFKLAVENGGRNPHLEVYYVVNLLEAIEALMPDVDGFMDRAEATVSQVDDLWRNLTVPSTPSADVEVVVEQAIRQGALLPSMRDWAINLGACDLDLLHGFLAASRAPTAEGIDARGAESAAAGLLKVQEPNAGNTSQAAPSKAAPTRRETKRARREAIVGSAA